jgi:hypothetical protein
MKNAAVQSIEIGIIVSFITELIPAFVQHIHECIMEVLWFSSSCDGQQPAFLVSSVPLHQVDQSALTGESLPVKRVPGDVAFSGSAVKQGERHAVVYATGANTFFGRAAALISGVNNTANIQKVGPLKEWNISCHL